MIQCATNGICGGGGFLGCQPPVMPATSCTCAPSYGCGQYGCYRLRARASKNYKPMWSRRPTLVALHESEHDAAVEAPAPLTRLEPLDEESILASASPSVAELRMNPTRPVNPNEAFYNCCIDRHLPDACLTKCNFNAYTKEALTRMYFKQDGCPLDAMREMQFCAAQGGDHRQCCARNGVTTTLAGNKCLTFCDQRPGKIQQLDVSYFPCFDRFESMKSCFWHEISKFAFER
ncbi:hypothetical protein AB6A40_003555, partial [Gnathostoma spinigerum]